MRGVKCVITTGDRVLLVRHSYGRREWELPGGGIKRGEAPAEAASREMEEELGVRIEQWRSLGQMWATSYHRRDRLHCFGTELGSPELSINRGELEAAQWFSRGALPSDLGRYVRPVLERATSAEATFRAHHLHAGP
jgi:8-oxo-dGTP pyrophosphatase MutT (NUDIX family)